MIDILAIKLNESRYLLVSRLMSLDSSPVVNDNENKNKRSRKHLKYVPWEPTRAAVSRMKHVKNVQSIPKHSVSTQLYRYQNSNRSSSPLPSLKTITGKETMNVGTKVKPTATVEPFQASVNVDDILYGIR